MYDLVFDPGRLGKRSDGTEITKLYAKPEVERVFATFEICSDLLSKN